MPTFPALMRQPKPAPVWRELKAGIAGCTLSLAPALTLGLLAFAALGAQATPLGIAGALVASAVGGAVFALLSRGPVPAGGPSATPVLVVGMLVAGVAADPGFSAQNPAQLAQLLALVAAAVVSMGLFQIALGLSGLLRFAQFVPQPVLAGFMNGVSLLAFAALLPLLLGWPTDALHGQRWQNLPPIQPATVVVGLATLAIIWGLPRLNPRLPATFIGLLGGTLLYGAVHAQLPQLPLGPLLGSIPPAWPQVDTLAPLLDVNLAPLLRQHAGAALIAGLTMALLGTLELVLNTLAMDQACHTRTEPRREALALGAANVASGLLGGLPVMFLRPRALYMREAGGRSRVGTLFASALFGLLIAATPALAFLPLVVLGAGLAVNAALMADRWSLGLLVQWWRGPRTADLQLALLVMGLVCAVTLVLGLPAAVASGALLSVILFMRTMNRSLVRRQCTAVDMPSRRVYMAGDEVRLQTLRERIVILELEGALFFGSADRVAQLAEGLDGRCHTLVLDFRRVSLIDASGAVVLLQLNRRLFGRGVTLRLAAVGANNRHGRLLRQFVGEGLVAEKGAADIDHAVEAAELELLAQAGVAPLRQTVPLEQTGLMADLDPAVCARLAQNLKTRHLADGEYLFRKGDPGNGLYVVTAGSISIYSAGQADEPDTLPQRFVSLSPGMMFGETAMLDGEGRSGDAVACGETVVHALDEDALRRLQAEDPQLAAQLYRNIALHLAQRLRAAAWAWRASSS